MKHIRKVLALTLAFLLVFSMAACNNNKNDVDATTTSTTSAAEKATIRIATLKGPTGMGMAKLMEDDATNKAANNYEFNIVSAPDEIVAAISSGSVDIAACPLNLAATLNKKTNGNVQILGVNTLGVLYVLQKGDEIKTVADLKGKKIYATGQGATPEYILNYVLQANGIDPAKDVTIEYKTEHSELATLAIAGEVEICMLPEPNVSTVLSQNADMKIALDLTKEWGKAYQAEGNNAILAQGGIIVRKDFAEKNAAAIESFLTEYAASAKFVNENADQASELIAKYGIIPKAPLAKKAIPNSNITLITGSEMKKMVEDNLNFLFNANPKSIGGTMPDESFYYAK